MILVFILPLSHVTYARWRHKFHLILRTKTKFFLRSHTCAATWISSAVLPFIVLSPWYHPAVLTSILRKLSLSDVETPAKWVSSGPGNVYIAYGILMQKFRPFTITARQFCFFPSHLFFCVGQLEESWMQRFWSVLPSNAVGKLFLTKREYTGNELLNVNFTRKYFIRELFIIEEILC